MITYTKLSEVPEEEKDQLQFSLAEFLIILVFVLAGTLLGALLDHLLILGYLPEGIVRALAGTADTLGFMVIGLYAFFVIKLRKNKVARINVLGLKREFTADSIGEYWSWITGGLIGLAIAFSLHGFVFLASDDPHGLIGVIYSFGYSNMDNFVAGLSVLVMALRQYDLRTALKWYFTHPFYVGNIIMLILIPVTSFLFRYSTGFRPDLNVNAGIESGLMDVDTIGAFVIMLLLTRLFKFGIPKVAKNK